MRYFNNSKRQRNLNFSDKRSIDTCDKQAQTHEDCHNYL